MATTTRRKTTEQKGLGYRHRLQADKLRETHRLNRDGSPCDWCGRPRWTDRTKNWDYDASVTGQLSGVLQADHSGMSRAEAIRRGLPIPLPDRLLHGECNRSRGAGGNDHLAAGGTKQPPQPTGLVMAWPW